MLYRTLSCAIALMLSLCLVAPAATLKTVDKGVEVDAGTLGKFTIEYPTLLGADQKEAHKIIEKNADGKTATVKYDGGASVQVSVDGKGAISYTFEKLPADVKQIKTMAILPFTGLQGGTFKVGDKEEKEFPADKPAKPHLYQGNAGSMTFKQADGTQIKVTAFREYSYLQLTDNREWGWKAYGFMTHTPYDPANPVMKMTVADPNAKTEGAAADAPKRVILVDAFGQPANKDFPDKVRSEAELKADAESEKAYYDALTPPTFDAYGGLPGSGEKLGLQKTGFFHVEKKADRWHLVDPEGNLFHALGVCVYSPVDDYTYVAGREGIYEWLPKREGEFATAYREKEKEALSFHLTNQIRKYGKPFEATEYQQRMLMRLRKWGFNTVGPFTAPTSAVKEANFAYVVTLPYGAWPGMPELPGAHGAWDPFEQANVDKLEREFAKSLPARANDPQLLGYYLNNEPLYEDLPRAVPKLNGTKHAAKKRLVQMLQEKYQTIDAFNKAWGMTATSFDALIEPGLPVSTQDAASDMQAYADLFFDTYYKLVHDTFKKHDQNHMLIGNRFQSGTINNERLVRICAKYMDVISFNYYTYAVDTDFLKRIYQWSDKPMMLTEWFYNSTKDSGLPGGGKDVASQAERGLAYRNYIEQSSTLPFVVGQTWFTLVDQSLTGRWFSKYSGENGNSGLIAVTDRPWKPLLDEAMKTNYTIYDLVLGQREAFAWDDPRFKLSSAGKRSLTIARATGPVAMDGTASGFPGTPAETISSKRLVTGSDAHGLEASFKLCYDDQNLYVLVDILDSTPMMSVVAPESLWSADGVELFIGHEMLDQPGQPLFSDRQILLGGSKEAKTYIAKVREQVAIRSVVVPRTDGKGYVLQAAIPVAALGFEPKEGVEIRFDLGIDDSADGKRRDRQLMWNGTERNSGDRTGWGRAAFVK